MSSVTINHRQPTVEEYTNFRNIVGWSAAEKEAVEQSIKHALFSVCLEKDSKIIGLGRVVGDGGLYFYIQDIIVLPEFRGLGYSKLIMDEVMNFIKTNAKKGAFIGLFSVKGIEGLYKKYGFRERPNEKYGSGMFLTI